MTLSALTSFKYTWEILGLQFDGSAVRLEMSLPLKACTWSLQIQFNVHLPKPGL